MFGPSQWFDSFLTGKRQSVRIGKWILRPSHLESGVPQGGILSPIIFTIFGTDLEDWTKKSTILSYTYDISSSSKGENVEEGLEKAGKRCRGDLEIYGIKWPVDQSIENNSADEE